MAAAYAALISLENIMHTLQLHPHPPISLPKNLLLLLTQKLTFLQKFLEGYNNLHDLDYTTEVDPLEIRIADAAYAAEDAIESHIVDHITNDMALTSYALYQDLEKVIEDMTLIEKEAIEIKKVTVAVQHQLPRKSTSLDSLRSSSSIAHNSSVVGVDDIKLQLMDKLLSDRRDLQIISIVGMGGAGKTTLARNIYQERLIEYRFVIRAWATISLQYSIRDILIQVLGQLNLNVDQRLSEDALGEELYKHLYGRRYLIIMDDMWKIDAWYRVRNFFPNNKNDSRIVVTTRLSNLASILSGSDRLDMRFLDEANSWNLLSKTVFGEESCPLELEEIGKKIGKSCRGLPLSIVVVGGFLAKSKHTIEFWGYVEKNLNSIVSLEDDERCLKVINMSYKQLPIHLKPCFLYMGVYREDSVIHVSELIKVLAAEGFVKPINGISLEETAKEYLKDLIDRNLILVHELGGTRNIKDCKIHDVVREFGLREARNERFYYQARPKTPLGIVNGQRRIVINSRCALEEVEMVDSLQPMPHLWRSALVRSCIRDLKEEQHYLDCFRLLRVLYTIRAPYSYTEEINSKNVTQLVNSRYLVITLLRLPSSICRCWNLQTLVFGDSFSTIIELPAEIWSMTQLRHIKVSGQILLHLPDPPASGEEDEMVLGNLQTLATIRNFKCSEEVVKRIPNLRKLKARYTEITDSLSNLACLHKLESLDVRVEKPSGDDERVVNLNPNFPLSLKKLKLSTSLFKSWQDVWEEMGKLPLLQKLLLDATESKERELETVKGTFPHLKFLGFYSFEHLEIWRMESSHFPCLERLHLEYVMKLNEVPPELADITTLGIIDVVNCSKSVEESAKTVAERKEELYGEAAFQVRAWEVSLENFLENSQYID